MNARTRPRWQTLLTMSLIGIAAGLATAAEARADGSDPLVIDGLDLHPVVAPGPDAVEPPDSGFEWSVPTADRLPFNPGNLYHPHGLGTALTARRPSLAFGIGPQLLESGPPPERLASDLAGDLLLERHRYALVGFAGYRAYRGWAVGPEAWVNADPSYRIRGLGIAVRDLRAGPLRIDLRLGATRQQDQARAINGGVEFRWYKP